MTHDDIFLQAVWAFAWRIGLALFVLYNIPAIIRGARRIWSEVRDYPPARWWRALPVGFGWGIAVSAVFLTGPFLQPPHDWSVVSIALIYVWGSVGILHAYRAADRWSQRRKKVDVSLLD